MRRAIVLATCAGIGMIGTMDGVLARAPDAAESSPVSSGWSDVQEVDPTPAALAEALDHEHSKEHRQLVGSFYNSKTDKAVLLFVKEQVEVEPNPPPKSK